MDKTLGLRPDLEDVHFDLARVYAPQGHFGKSFQEFNNLFQSELRFALYHIELGKMPLVMGLIPPSPTGVRARSDSASWFRTGHRELRSLDKRSPTA
ncbi:hypothetical protein DFAR_1030002 [Desulfarculales bacterium]